MGKTEKAVISSRLRVDRQLIDTIRQIRIDCETQSRQQAQSSILYALDSQLRLSNAERIRSGKYLKRLSTQDRHLGSKHASSCVDLSDETASDDYLIMACPKANKTESALYDPALTSLHSIAQNSGRNPAVVVMKRKSRNPKYSAWIPVPQNFLDNDVEMDTFRPYFGESKAQMEKAEEVYRQMLEDANPTASGEEISDGDFDDGGDLYPRAHDQFYTLAARRLRASQRFAVAETIRLHGDGDSVRKALCVALKIPDTRRIKHIFEVSRVRSEKARYRSEEKRKLVEREKSICSELTSPKENISSHDCESLDNMAFAEQHFCLRCHVFCCEMHIGETVRPTRPILDETITERVGDLSRGVAKPCSPRCFLLEVFLQAPKGVTEDLPWTEEEIMLLTEGFLFTEQDPCRLSMIIGTKCCREVHNRVSNALEKTLVVGAVDAARLEAKSQLGRRRTKKKGGSTANNTPFTKLRKGQDSSSPRRKSKQLEEEDDDEEPDESIHACYVPCNHTGACNKSNGCICSKNDIYCEPTCACNSGRFVQIGTAVKWDPQSEGTQKASKGFRCKNRHTGCNCSTGFCNTDDCECYVAHRVCSPDFCHHCEAKILPHYVDITERRCRNTDLITARHKRTVAGISAVHGFGLFAMDYFEAGDLVGHYCGRTVDSKKVDMILRTSDAKKLTYAFNLTSKMTIDGQCLGSKVRLINHSSKGKDVNCHARFERVRGEGRIAIKAFKSVKPGGEFLFNYNITQGNEWLNNGSEGGSDDRLELEDSPASKKESKSLTNRTTVSVEDTCVLEDHLRGTTVGGESPPNVGGDFETAMAYGPEDSHSTSTADCPVYP